MANQNTKLAQKLLLSVESGANALPGTALVSGELVSGTTYIIGDFNSGDDFTNIGGTNTSGTIFKATGTTPTTWTNGSTLREIHKYALALPNPSYNLTNTGAIPTYGHLSNNSYYSFDGVDDAVSLAHDAKYSFSGNMSLVAKIKSGNSIASDQRIVWKGTDGASTLEYGFFITSGNIYFQFGNGTSQYSISTAIAVNTVYNVAITRSATSLTMQVNGVDISPTAITGTPVTGTGNLYIGRETPAATNYFGGQIYSIQLFNYALTASDVLYYSSPSNHLRAVDQAPSTIYSNTAWTGATGATPPTGWLLAENGTFTIFDSGDGSPYNACLKIADNGSVRNPFIYKEFTVVVGQKYKVEYMFKHGDGTGGRVHIGTTASGSEYSLENGITDATWTKHSITFTATSTNLSVGLRANTASSGQYELFDELYVYLLGNVLNLTPEGMLGSPTQGIWRDYYHSTDIALSGATAPRLVKSWSGMNAWRLTASSYLNLASFTKSIYTISFWLNIPETITTSNGYSLLGLYNSGDGAIRIGAFTGGLTDELIYIGTGSGQGNYYALNGGTIPIGWHHYCFVWTGAKYQIYLDGIALTTQDRGTPSLITSGYLSIGKELLGSGAFVGIIEGLGLYGESWSAEKIALSYSVYND